MQRSNDDANGQKNDKCHGDEEDAEQHHGGEGAKAAQLLLETVLQQMAKLPVAAIASIRSCVAQSCAPVCFA